MSECLTVRPDELMFGSSEAIQEILKEVDETLNDHESNTTISNVSYAVIVSDKVVRIFINFLVEKKNCSIIL